jgi:CubicO group peptidase (beta-lactamase class C family)
MVVASVSKMVVAFAIAHLQQDGLVDVDAPMPWDAIGITPHPAWLDVTLRELLDHTSGMPVVRESWFTGVGDCADFLPSLVASAPRGHRGRWTYSNGNYCALGRLIEQTTGDNLDEAVQELVFDPLGLDGIHLTTDGLRPGDVPHGYRVERLSRLGGAGVFVVSTDDLAAMLSTTTAADLTTLLPPGLMTDQYGWGHTGTIDGAKACVWVLELGRTVLAATVAGNNPSTGGGVCDRVVPAVAADVGVGNGAAPNRTP